MYDGGGIVLNLVLYQGCRTMYFQVPITTIHPPGGTSCLFCLKKKVLRSSSGMCTRARTKFSTINSTKFSIILILVRYVRVKLLIAWLTKLDAASTIEILYVRDVIEIPLSCSFRTIRARTYCNTYMITFSLIHDDILGRGEDLSGLTTYM